MSKQINTSMKFQSSDVHTTTSMNCKNQNDS